VILLVEGADGGMGECEDFIASAIEESPQYPANLRLVVENEGPITHDVTIVMAGPV
jgi:hypothetical protein